MFYHKSIFIFINIRNVCFFTWCVFDVWCIMNIWCIMQRDSRIFCFCEILNAFFKVFFASFFDHMKERALRGCIPGRFPPADDPSQFFSRRFLPVKFPSGILTWNPIWKLADMKFQNSLSFDFVFTGNSYQDGRIIEIPC